MIRYIDADELKESFRKQTVNVPEKIKEDADAIIEAICKDIDLAPTVDAVPVVRCGECRFYKPWNSDGEYGKCKTGLSVMADMFCSCGSRADGERKDGEG